MSILPPNTPRFCLQCGGELRGSVPSRTPKSYCSYACANLHYQARYVGKFTKDRAKPCAHCGQDFQATRPDTKYCSVTCRGLAQRKSPVACKQCGKPFWASAERGRVTCSDECKRLWAGGKQSGLHSHRWRGGRTDLLKVLRNSAAYRQWRAAVFTRDAFTCQLCHESGGRLSAHHIHPFHTHQEMALVVANGITLCWPCHLSIKGRESDFQAQFFAITYKS